MNRPLAFALCLAVAAITACSSRHAPTAETNQPAQTEANQSAAKPEAQRAQPDGLQPGQASGTYTAKGEVVELKYAYAGRAVRFGTDSMVILLTDKPIPADAVAEELKSAPLLESEKIRGLEYVIDEKENGMWVRYHPSQYQESSSNKLKEYTVENGIVRGIDDNSGDLSEGKYARNVKFAAAVAK